MTKFPLGPQLTKLLLTCEEFSCINEVLPIVYMLWVPSLFFSQKDRTEESDAAHAKKFMPESDYLTLLNIYKQWEANKYCGDWCSTHYIQVKALRKAREGSSQLLDILRKLMIWLTSCGSNWDIIRKVICSVYFHNAAESKGIRNT